MLALFTISLLMSYVTHMNWCGRPTFFAFELMLITTIILTPVDGSVSRGLAHADTMPAIGDEFVGPFASWMNVKTFGAKGDGITDDRGYPSSTPRHRIRRPQRIRALHPSGHVQNNG